MKHNPVLRKKVYAQRKYNLTHPHSKKQKDKDIEEKKRE